MVQLRLPSSPPSRRTRTSHRCNHQNSLILLGFGCCLLMGVCFHLWVRENNQWDVRNVATESALWSLQQQQLNQQQSVIMGQVARPTELGRRTKVEPFGVLVPPDVMKEATNSDHSVLSAASRNETSNLHWTQNKTQPQSPDSNSRISTKNATISKPTSSSLSVSRQQQETNVTKPFDLKAELQKAFGEKATLVLDKLPSSCKGKERVIWFLILAGIEIPKDLCLQLPHWDTVASMYGEAPVFDNRVCGNLDLDPLHREVLPPRISGPANAGNGMLKRLLKWNIDRIGYKTKLSPKSMVGIASRESLFRRFLHWIVPNDPPKPYLRVVLTKDPFMWMQSICLTPSHVVEYPPAASMDEEVQTVLGLSLTQQKKQDPHCPHLVTQKDNTTGKFVTFPVQVKSSDELAHKKVEEFPTLIEYWNEWMAGFMTQEEPDDGESGQDYIVIRFEDLIFHPLETLQAIGDCAGLSLVQKSRQPLTFLAMGQKQLQMADQSSEYLDRTITTALVFYSNGIGNAGLPQRTAGMTQWDLEYAHQHLDMELVQRLGYRLPPISSTVHQDVNVATTAGVLLNQGN